jgi:hypothetical protein
VTSLLYRDAGLVSARITIFLLFTGFNYGLIQLEVAAAQTTIVPSLSISGEYDSNVFWTPKSLLDPGTKAEDFITRVTPQITVAHMGSLVRGNISVGALVTKYLHNPELDYTGINAAGRLDLNQAAQRLSRRITDLSVAGTYQFTPSMSEFGAVGGQFGGNYGATGVNPVVGAGLVTNRVSLHTTTVGITGGYAVTPTTNLTAAYDYTTVVFGQQQSEGVQNPLFNTTGHTGSLSLGTQLNPRDTVGASATISHFSQEQSTAGGQGSFTIPMATINWSRRWTQELNTALGAGALFTLPMETELPGQTLKSQVFPTINAAINYSSFSDALRAGGSALGPFAGLPSLSGSLSPGAILSPGQYLASLSYNYSVFPSYAYNAGPIKAHVLGANFSGGITPKLSGTVGMNFSHGSSTAASSSFTFETIGATVGARYLLGPILASLTLNRLYFATTTSEGQLSSEQYAFSKYSILLALSYAFNSQLFFKRDSFGYAGASRPNEGASGSGAGSGTAPSTGGPKK